MLLQPVRERELEQQKLAGAERQRRLFEPEPETCECDDSLELLDPGSGPADLRRARAYLGIAETRLAELQRSRDVLIGGEDQSEAEAEAS